MTTATALLPTVKRATVARLDGLSTAVPAFVLTQDEALRFVLNNFPLRDATKVLYKRVFSHESVATRHFALENLQEILDADHDHVNARFAQRATELSAQSLRRALAHAGAAPDELDFLAVTTCTGYLCPGLSATTAEVAGLRSDIRRADIVGMGCGAALPALEQAAQFLAAHPEGLAAVVSTEICSAALFSDDDPGLVISNALFADGSACAVLRGVDIAGDPTSSAPAPRIVDFESRLYPQWRDDLRFKTDGGRLRNVLGKNVPNQVADALREIIPTFLHRMDLSETDITHWIFHAGGDKILSAAEAAMNLPPQKLASARRILQRYGNMSSPTVLFVLQELIQSDHPQPGELGLLISFGAGFSVNAALIEF